MRGTLCLFIGNKTPFSVRRALENISWMLAEDFTIHVVTSVEGSLPFDDLRIDHIYQGRERNVLHPYSSEFGTLDAYLREYTPSLVWQLTEPPRLGTIGGLACRRNDVPFVYRYSGDRFAMPGEASGVTSTLGMYVKNALIGRVPLRLGDHFVTLGPTGQQRLLNRGVDRPNISVLPPSVDVHRFSGSTSTNAVPAEISRIADEYAVALFVGRMTELKGIDTVEDTLPRILDHRDDLHFLFVGDAKTLDIPDRYRDRTTTVGRVPPGEIPQYYNLADVLVHPSRIEAYARSIMEGLATGIPVVGRQTGEIPYITRNTFASNTEFVRMVCNFESLDVDDIQPFSRSRLKRPYVDAFETLCAELRSDHPF